MNEPQRFVFHLLMFIQFEKKIHCCRYEWFLGAAAGANKKPEMCFLLF